MPGQKHNVNWQQIACCQYATLYQTMPGLPENCYSRGEGMGKGRGRGRGYSNGCLQSV